MQGSRVLYSSLNLVRVQHHFSESPNITLQKSTTICSAEWKKLHNHSYCRFPSYTATLHWKNRAQKAHPRKNKKIFPGVGTTSRVKTSNEVASKSYKNNCTKNITWCRSIVWMINEKKKKRKKADLFWIWKKLHSSIRLRINLKRIIGQWYM